MNSNARTYLASLLNKDQVKQPKYRESFRDKNQSQRIFGKQISNCSGLVKQKQLIQRPHSKSITTTMMQTRQQIVDLKLKQIMSRKTHIIEPKNNSVGNNQCTQNSQNVNEYQQQIMQYLIKQQIKNPMNNNVLENQTQINEKSRSTLIDWLIDAHLKFKLLPETLFKTVRIIDKYLQKNQVPKTKFQLLAIASLFIASKYQQIYPPQPKSFVSLAQRSYTFSEMVEMQSKILKLFDFNINFSTSLVFLERFLLDYNLNQKQCNMCRYLLELSLLQIKYLTYSPELVAFSTIFLMTYLLKKQLTLDFKIINNKQNEVKECAKQLCLTLQNVQKSGLQMTRKKYSTYAYSQVAKIYIQPQTNLLI